MPTISETLIMIIGVSLFWGLVWDLRRQRSRERERDNLRHIAGARPWWGGR